MIIAHHLYWTAYGRWLPNDIRGSYSHEVRVEEIAQLGELHYGRKPVQPSRPEYREFLATSADALKHPRFKLSDDDVTVIAKSFAKTVTIHKYTCYACAIMPDHVHLLIRKHREFAEAMSEHFQEESRSALIQANRRAAIHPVWTKPGGKVFLNTRDDMLRVIRYIENNPIKIGLPSQVWPFVTKYDGWLPRGAER